MAGAHRALGAWPDSKLPLVPASRWPNQVSRPCRLWGRSHGVMPRVQRRRERGPGSGSVHSPASSAAEHSPPRRLGPAVLESLLRSGSSGRNGAGHGGEHAGAALTTSKHGPEVHCFLTGGWNPTSWCGQGGPPGPPSWACRWPPPPRVLTGPSLCMCPHPDGFFS